MPSKRFQQPTEFKVEFWTCASGHNRKHRHRYYRAAEGMIRAGARWEAKGGDYWCRYWNGLRTWVSATRSKLDPSRPALIPETLGRAAELASATTIERARRRPRLGSQIFSIFGMCEAAAAEVMLKDGRIGPKIPADQIPDTVLHNEFGNKALFAVTVPNDQIPTFEKLIKGLRA